MESYEKEFLSGLAARLAGVEADIYKLKVKTKDQECLKEDIKNLVAKAAIKFHNLKRIMEGK